MKQYRKSVRGPKNRQANKVGGVRDVHISTKRQSQINAILEALDWHPRLPDAIAQQFCTRYDPHHGVG